MTFTRMDESTAEQWQHIIVESIEHQPRVADRVLAMLASLEEITDGFEVDQLVHSLQTATRAGMLKLASLATMDGASCVSGLARIFATIRS